jgi:transposase
LADCEKSIKNNYYLLQSIKGVGKTLAMTTIIKTANFTKFSNARKFACFCGTAPFENTSGTSIRGKTRVSHLADKRMKTLLDLGAKTAIQYDKELREYYLKRTTNGKSKMSTINVVRNKLLYRMFAVIKRQTPFTENYLQIA